MLCIVGYAVTKRCRKKDEPEAGHSLGDYRAIRKIAQGGQGQVLLIERKVDKRLFALKVTICHDHKDRMAALAEFEIMRECQGHANMIELVDMFMNWEEEEDPGRQRADPQAIPLLNGDGNPASVVSSELQSLDDARGNQMSPRSALAASDDMAIASLTHAPRFVAVVSEFYPTGSLTKYILGLPEGTHMSEPLVWSCVIQLGSLLSFLHHKSPPVIHQDLKPDNVLVDKDNQRLVVTDFGLAFKMTKHCAVKRMGTHFFMSPETCSGRSTTKSDVWALGCVLYVMCTKKATGDRGARYMFRDIREKATPDEFYDEVVSELRDELGYSDHLSALCVHMLRLAPEDRPTAAEVVKYCVESAPTSPGTEF